MAPETLDQVVLAMLRVARERWPDRNASVSEWAGTTRNADGQVVGFHRGSHVPNTHAFHLSLRSAWRESDCGDLVAKFQSSLKTDQNLSPRLSRWFREREALISFHELEAVVLNQALHYLERGMDEPRHMREAARKTLTQLRNPLERRVFVLPLEHVSIVRTEFRLGQHLSLRSVDDRERDYLINAICVDSEGEVQSRIGRANALIRYDLPSTTGGYSIEDYERIEDLMRTVLNLISITLVRDVQTPGLMDAWEGTYPYWVGAARPYRYQHPLRFPPPVRMGLTDLRRLSAHLKSAADGPNAEKVDYALRKHMDILVHSRDEDRLVDAWAGLEALMVGDSQSELRYRLALRLAAMQPRGDRRQVYELVQESYDLRSKVVHGSLKGRACQSLGRVSEETVILYRKTLASILAMKTAFKCQALEQRLLA